MRKNLKTMKTATAIGGAAAALVLVGSLTSPAEAAGTKWVLGYADSTSGTPHYAGVGDVINSTNLNLKFTGRYNGNVASIDCANVATTGFSYTVPAGGPPSGAPGSTISIMLNTPTTTMTGCTNSVDGAGVNVTFAAGSQWQLDIGPLPAAHTVVGTPHMGTLNGKITVPSGSSGNGTVTVSAPTLAPFPCVIQAPAAGLDLEVAGTYNPTTGVAADDGSKPIIDINNSTSPANCSQVDVEATLQYANVTLAGPGGVKPTAVWQ
ncbi:hypothetical protein KVF89_04495 [Nocardioides carbamazepini]|uniref:hypothetical protein n=1 Tax=Nocardioides carbamazepini TaxID=2854259 RepID=UPI00214A3645|nr:hypothetical protein [Nocardioides carbamazepini]MCR1781787.1 hypothetical protein [Nocardioides carbamazepini]